MNNDRSFELLSAGADGDLTDGERDELATLIRESADTRKLQAQLDQMEDILASVPDVEPPATLSEQIIRAAKQRIRPNNKAKSQSNILPDWLYPIRWGAVFRYSASTAFGALLVMALYESQPNYGPSANITEMVGTMAADADDIDLTLLDRYSFATTSFSSIVRLERRNDALVLDIRIDTSDLVEVAVDFEDSGLEIEALAQTNSNFESIQFADQVLRVKGRGQRRFAVLLRSQSNSTSTSEAKITLEYSSNGNLLQQGTLSSIR